MNRQRKPDTRKQPETTPFKSKAQKAYKTQRRKNDIYSTTGGHKNLKSGAPYNLKSKRAGTDRLRFEVLEVDPEGFPINDELEPLNLEGRRVASIYRQEVDRDRKRLYRRATISCNN